MITSLSWADTPSSRFRLSPGCVKHSRWNCSVRSMFEAPTVATLAAHLETILWATQGLQGASSVTEDEYEEGEV